MESTPVDITPDKSLIKKLGLTGYRTEQAIAELIDNSIDARIQGKKETVTVRLDFSNRRIEVIDDGTGMTVQELKDAMTIAKGKKTDEKLGKFGLGMKSACSALGKKFTITTTKYDSNIQCFAEYDEEKWLADDSQGWQNFRIIHKEQNDNWHGTRIEISKLNVSLYPNQVSNFKERFGIRYAPYLEDGQIKLRINSIPVEASEPNIKENTRREIIMTLPSGRIIKGWIALLKKRSIKGDYGFHLFKNGRLIKAFDKFGMRIHPQTSNVIGRLDLDHVPVNFHKSAFIEDSDEFKEAEKIFSENSILKQILKEAVETRETSSSTKQVLDYLTGSAPAGYLDTRIRADVAKKMLDEIKEYKPETLDKSPLITFFDGTEPLYTVNHEDGRLKVLVNRNNEAFHYVKNPLILIGLITIEAQLLLANPKLYDEFIEKRNTKWLQFLKDWTRKEAKDSTGRVVEPPSYLNYGLAEDLIEIHDILKHRYENKFQFTALSTLYGYLHNALGKLIYTIQTTPGSGQYLTDLLNEIVNDDIILRGEFVVVFDLKGNELNAVINASSKNKILVIRETSEYLGFAVTKPEKAWMDLFMEIDTNGIPVSKSELVYTLDSLLKRNLVNKNEIIKLLKHHKRIGKALAIIGELL